MSILQNLDTIAAESGTNAKIALLKTLVADEENGALLKKVIYNALSPRVKFYVKQLMPVDTFNDLISLDEAIDGLLDIIATRRLTGTAALVFINNLQSSLSQENSMVLDRIIGKDLKIGMQATNINKVVPKLIEETPYMGAVSYDKTKVEKLFATYGTLEAQIKIDGRYCNAILTNSGLQLESRSGETTYLNDTIFADELLAAYSMADTMDFVLTGELTIPGISRYKSNGIINSLVKMGQKVAEGESIAKEEAKFIKENNITPEEIKKQIVYTVWDIITVDGYLSGFDPRSYNERLDQLTTILTDLNQSSFGCTRLNFVDGRTVKSLEEAVAYFRDVLVLEEEGLILKATIEPWKDGKPTYQVKMKLNMTVDLKVVGFQDGTKGTKNEGKYSAILLESSDGKIKTKAAGLKESEIDYVTANAESLLGRIAEIKCCGITKVVGAEYSALLHPAFVEFRTDKVEADSFEVCIAHERMMLGLTD